MDSVNLAATPVQDKVVARIKVATHHHQLLLKQQVVFPSVREMKIVMMGCSVMEKRAV